jgi:hypothetical protein
MINTSSQYIMARVARFSQQQFYGLHKNTVINVKRGYMEQSIIDLLPDSQSGPEGVLP